MHTSIFTDTKDIKYIILQCPLVAVLSGYSVINFTHTRMTDGSCYTL